MTNDWEAKSIISTRVSELEDIVWTAYNLKKKKDIDELMSAYNQEKQKNK